MIDEPDPAYMRWPEPVAEVCPECGAPRFRNEAVCTYIPVPRTGVICGHVFPPAPEAECDCATRADGIGAMHGHHDEQCPLAAATPSVQDEEKCSAMTCNDPRSPECIYCESHHQKRCGGQPHNRIYTTSSVHSLQLAAEKAADRICDYYGLGGNQGHIGNVITAIITECLAGVATVPRGVVELLDAALLHPETAEGHIRQAIEMLSGGVATVEQGCGVKCVHSDANSAHLCRCVCHKGDFRAGVAACVEKVKEMRNKYAQEAEHQTSYAPAIDYDKRNAASEIISALESLTDSAPPPATVEQGISFVALIDVLERLKSKNANPERQWYEGWNAALNCLINDAKSARFVSAPPPATPQEGEQKEATKDHQSVLVNYGDTNIFE